MQARLSDELKLSISIKCFPKRLITFYNRRLEILTLKFSSKNCFFISFAQKGKLAVESPLFCLGMFLLLLPHSGSLEYVCRVVVFFCLSRHLKRGRVARESFIFTQTALLMIYSYRQIQL